MDDLDLMREFCGEEAPPGPGDLAALRARVVAGLGAQAPRRRSRARAGLPWFRRRWISRRARLALTGVIAAGLAGVAAAMLIVPAGSARPPAGPAAGGVRLDAASVLHHAARAALTAPLPGKNSFLYAETTTYTNVSGTQLRNPAHKWLPAEQDRRWLSVTGKQAGTQYSAPCHSLIPPSYRASCVGVIPLPPPPGSIGADFTYAELRRLPTAPGPLLRFLAQEQEPPCRSQMAPGTRLTQAQLEWSGIATILADVPVLPPRFGAALFNAAAQIPGITVERGLMIAGQQGIAVVRSDTLALRLHKVTFRTEFVFGASTYRYIGSASTSQGASRGQYGYFTLLATSRFTTHAPAPGRIFLAAQPRCEGPSVFLMSDLGGGSMGLQPTARP